MRNAIDMKSQNVTVNILKAIACVTVILQHCTAWMIDRYNADFHIITTCHRLCSNINVPLFFILSGFLLHRQNVVNFLSKRVIKIIVPFVFFTSLKLIYNLNVGSFAHGNSLSSQLYHAFGIGELYWFSYAIMTMYIISPLFWRIKNIEFDGKEYEFPISAIIIFVGVFIFNIVNEKKQLLVSIPNVFMIKSTLEFLPYYLLGFIFKYIKGLLQLKNIVYKVIEATVVLFSILLIYSYYKGNTITINYFCRFLTSAFLCYFVFLLVKRTKRISWAMYSVSQHTYQIFFLDSFVKVIIFTMIEMILGVEIYQSLYMCILIAFVEVSSNTIISCGISLIAGKIPVINFLFGLSNKKIIKNDIHPELRISK